MNDRSIAVGFDAVLFDTQHGECGFEEARDGIAAARLAGKPSVVRLSIDGQAEGARMLDVGAGMHGTVNTPRR